MNQSETLKVVVFYGALQYTPAGAFTGSRHNEIFSIDPAGIDAVSKVPGRDAVYIQTRGGFVYRTEAEQVSKLLESYGVTMLEERARHGE